MERMNTEISTLEPSEIWKHFYALTRVPRPSKSEQKIIGFVKEFGEGLGLQTIIDDTGNVIIKKPASKGKEHLPGVIIQAHLDMVPQKNSDKKHDFEQDPISAYVDGEWVRADGTTLGSDNGIGVAAAMAILESRILEHGPLEALFTVDEETGMTGAFKLKPGVLNGKILLNLDSEEEGELYIGCAGGVNTTGTFRCGKEYTPAGMKGFRLAVTGLRGGHSGLDIHLGRGNSNKLLVRFMHQAGELYGMRLSSIEGGSLRNAIPRESFAEVAVPELNVSEFLETAADYGEMYRQELGSVEPGLSFQIGEVTVPETLIPREVQDNLVRAVYGMPNGVMRMSADMPGVVETSTNLAIVKSENSSINVLCLLRSSVDSAKKSLADSIRCVLELAGAEVVHDGDYPGWKPDINSPILRTMKKVYQGLFGKMPEVKVIHAGLECGIIGDVYPGLDMISFGPTIRHPHSPDEKVHVESVKKFWQFLTRTLGEIA